MTKITLTLGSKRGKTKNYPKHGLGNLVSFLRLR
jgi:hypothetical protein